MVSDCGGHKLKVPGLVQMHRLPVIPVIPVQRQFSRHVAGRRDTGSESLWLM